MLLRFARNFAIIFGAVVVSIAILYFSIPNGNTGQSSFDVIVVTGPALDSGGELSPAGRASAMEGVERYRAGRAGAILFTGAEPHSAAAQSMARYAQAQDVPASAIFVENQGRDTVQSVYYAFQLMQSHDWDSALVVCMPSQVRWASLIFRYYPIAWRVQAAPWPPDIGRTERLRLWSVQILRAAYARIFGLPESNKFLPHVRFVPPKL